MGLKNDQRFVFGAIRVVVVVVVVDVVVVVVLARSGRRVNCNLHTWIAPVSSSARLMMKLVQELEQRERAPLRRLGPLVVV